MSQPVSASRHFPRRLRSLLALPALGLGLAACGGEDPGAPSPEAAAVSSAPEAAAPAGASAADCGQEPGIDYLCGPRNAEDLVRLGDSRWLLASGMNSQISGGDFSGRIHLIDPEARSFQVLFPGEAPMLEQDTQMFAGCPGPLDVDNFSAHGLALRDLDRDAQTFQLYVTSHGAREAIEVFEVTMGTTQPAIKWVGCVPLPETAWSNSVTILPDGGFYATQFIPAGETIDPVLAGEITGHVFEWHPGQAVEVVEGTELSGPNGIETGQGGALYVAAYGTQEVVRFDMSSRPPAKESVALPIHPDNLRWTPEGTLYTAGGLAGGDCGEPECGWAVMEIQPDTLEAERVAGAGPDAMMQGISVALKVNDDIWVGSFAGDRVGILPVPAE